MEKNCRDGNCYGKRKISWKARPGRLDRGHAVHTPREGWSPGRGFLRDLWDSSAELVEYSNMHARLEPLLPDRLPDGFAASFHNTVAHPYVHSILDLMEVELPDIPWLSCFQVYDARWASFGDLALSLASLRVLTDALCKPSELVFEGIRRRASAAFFSTAEAAALHTELKDVLGAITRAGWSTFPAVVMVSLQTPR